MIKPHPQSINMTKIRPTCHHGEIDRNWKNLLIPDSVDVGHLQRLGPPDLPAPLPPIIIRTEEFYLKKLHCHTALSRETNAFDAEVWFRKKLVGRARDDGGGGETIIDPVAQGSLDEVTDWAAALPPESCYQQIYEEMSMGGGEFITVAIEAWQEDSRCVTYSMGLNHLIGSFVERAAWRKGIRHIKACMLLGPPKAHPYRSSILVRYKKTITPELLEHERKLHLGACPLTEVFDLPFHYYPSPHPFYGLGWPPLQVVVGEAERRGEVVNHGTNDHQVSVWFGDDPAATVAVRPSAVRFLSGEEESYG